MKLLPIRKKGFLILVALCAAATAYFAMPQTKPLVTTSVAMTAPAAHSKPIFPASFPMPQTKPPATTATTAAEGYPRGSQQSNFSKDDWKSSARQSPWKFLAIFNARPAADFLKPR